MTTAVQYREANPVAIHQKLMETNLLMLAELDNFPPMVMKNGVITVRDWLKQHGVVLE